MLNKPTKFEIGVIIEKLKEEAEELTFMKHESLVDVLDLLIKQRKNNDSVREQLIKLTEKL